MSYPFKTRREFLQLGLAASLFTAFPASLHAFVPTVKMRDKTLSFYNTHTGEYLDRVTFFTDEGLIPESLELFNWILRDHRSSEIAQIDATLFPIIADLCETLSATEPIHIISGYRSPETNSLLAQNSTGVAKKSYHMKGMAIDLRVPGRDLNSVRKAAQIVGIGGVGYYPESGFVHIDSGPKRSWSGN